ncbi:471_t:CDS:1, partial [Racocetra persica]
NMQKYHDGVFGNFQSTLSTKMSSDLLDLSDYDALFRPLNTSVNNYPITQILFTLPPDIYSP